MILKVTSFTTAALLQYHMLWQGAPPITTTANPFTVCLTNLYMCNWTVLGILKISSSCLPHYQPSVYNFRECTKSHPFTATCSTIVPNFTTDQLRNSCCIALHPDTSTLQSNTLAPEPSSIRICQLHINCTSQMLLGIVCLLADGLSPLSNITLPSVQPAKGNMP